MAYQPSAGNTPFERLWRGFLTARVMVALALLALQLLGMALNQVREPALLATCLGYLAATALLRLLGDGAPPQRGPGLQWLPSIGVDLLLVSLMQVLQHAGTMNFTPLFGLPILMASVLGTLLLALGTTAGVTLLLLAWAWWQDGTSDASRYLQTALTGTGYFIVAYLAQQLATRLTSEQQVAQRSQMDARTQKAVSALVMQHVADGVLVLDQQGLVRLANPAAMHMLGHDDNAAVPFMLGHSSAWAPLMELAHKAFLHEQPEEGSLNILHEGQPPMGLHVRIWVTHSQEHDTALAEPLCVMFLHDLREMEARLRTEKLASMGRMSAAVAHEIRNPLAAIVQANELLDEDLDDPGHKRLTLMVRQNAERLVRITEDVLDIARVQHQIGHTPSNTLALDASVAQVWADWRAHEPARRQGLLLLEAGDATQVEFDADHLRRVLINLLDNALRYMSQEAGALLLATRITGSGRAELQVWSDGAPLDKSVERHLFEPFFSSESRSSGLGLYICRELCQRHGAAIGYRRSVRTLERGQIEGNAFIVTFRGAIRPADTGSLFDTIVV